MDKRLVVKRERELFKYAVDGFERLIRVVTKRPRFSYKAGVNDVRAWESWCEEYKDRVISVEFINSYLEYGIQSWFNKNTAERDYYDIKIRFSWVFGKSAVKRYNALDDRLRKEVVRTHLKKVVNKGLIVSKKESDRDVMLNSVIEREEECKSKYHNTPRGMLWCTANTTLYHHRSSYCTTCVYKQDCKELLKREMTLVYKKRGYDE